MRMSVKATRSTYGAGAGGDPVSWFRGKVTRIENGSEQVLQQAMDDGAEMMRENIATRGTVKSGKRGRIESHKMIDEVKSPPVSSFGEGKARGKFGWVDEKETYFGAQEGGFEHSPGVDVEGMYALADAAEWAMKQFQADMKDVIRDA